jgi:small-conductance mechanosensitive channel
VVDWTLTLIEANSASGLVGGAVTREFAIRVAVAVCAIVIAVVAAKLIDRRLARRHLAPGTVTRYRILRQSILWTILFVGILSALLVFPHVRAIATAILASSALIGLVLGFSAQRTIGNFIAGLLIAFTQPVRLGDEIELDGNSGVVEEVGLIYTWVRTPDSDRLVIPNEKLVSETVRNSTIRNDRPLAQITVRVPLDVDLQAVVSALEPYVDQVVVTQLAEQAAVVAVRRYVEPGVGTERTQSALRIEVADRLRRAGITGAAE